MRTITTSIYTTHRNQLHNQYILESEDQRKRSTCISRWCCSQLNGISLYKYTSFPQNHQLRLWSLIMLTRERPCFPSDSASLSRPVCSIYLRRWECCQATFCQPAHTYQWLVMCFDSTDISTNEIIQSTSKRWQGCQSLSTTFSHFQTPIHFFGRVTAHKSTSSNLIRCQVYLINALMHVQWCCDTRCVSVLWTRLSTWKSRWISTSHFLRFFLFLPFSKQVLFNFGTRLLVYSLS